MTAKIARMAPQEADVFGMAATSTPEQFLGTVRVRIPFEFRTSGGDLRRRTVTVETSHCETLEMAAYLVRNARVQNPEHTVLARFTVEM